jgi:hypothetical protein
VKAHWAPIKTQTRSERGIYTLKDNPQVEGGPNGKKIFPSFRQTINTWFRQN